MMLLKRNNGRLIHWIIIFVLYLWGCAHHQPLRDEPYQLLYASEAGTTSESNPWPPSFIVYDHFKTYNRIGRPSLAVDDKGRQKIYIDADDPVVYVMKRSFKTNKAEYTNHIYRIHFPRVPYRLIPFHLTAGKNVGLMVVVTLNADNLPVLITTVHTCGCYKAIVPTQHLSNDALPEKWTGKPLNVYGEKLPALLRVQSDRGLRLLVHLRPGVHRVMNLEVLGSQVLSSQKYRVIPMKTEPMRQLKTLQANDNGAITSFFHTKGIMKGHVKGSVKPLETLLMSLISMDLFVGTDKDYADAAETGNPFYTSLKPWRRNDSDMWHFARFLAYWGWRL